MISTESKSKLQRLTMKKNNSIHQISSWDPERGQVWINNMNDHDVNNNMKMIRDIDQDGTKCSDVGIIVINAKPVISRLVESEESLIRSTTIK